MYINYYNSESCDNNAKIMWPVPYAIIMIILEKRKTRFSQIKAKLK